MTADVKQFSCEIIDQLADAVGSAVSLEQVLQVARGAVRIAESRGHGRIACVRRGDSHESPCIQTGEMPVPPDISRAENETSPPTAADAKARLGVAQDEAFHFYYPDNLEALERSGCALIPFSPMHDGALPENLNGIYIGGGYPEEHAQRLAANQSMLESIRQFADSNRVIYAECGGLMYLSQGIETLEGARHQMLGLVPAWTKMCPRRKSLGYVEVTLTRDCLWGRAGDVLRGHEFHYSEIVPLSGLEMPVLSELPVHSSACELAYELRYRRSDYPVTEGFHRGNILGSYAHLHFASRPDAVQHFMSRLQLS